jgi:hypothetical protein
VKDRHRKQKLKTLIRRADYLRKKIEDSSAINGYATQELFAIEWAISELIEIYNLQELRNARGNS